MEDKSGCRAHRVGRRQWVLWPGGTLGFVGSKGMALPQPLGVLPLNVGSVCVNWSARPCSCPRDWSKANCCLLNLSSHPQSGVGSELENADC